jgi:hypothetical protein
LTYRGWGLGDNVEDVTELFWMPHAVMSYFRSPLDHVLGVYIFVVFVLGEYASDVTGGVGRVRGEEVHHVNVRLGTRREAVLRWGDFVPEVGV